MLLVQKFVSNGEVVPIEGWRCATFHQMRYTRCASVTLGYLPCVATRFRIHLVIVVVCQHIFTYFSFLFCQLSHPFITTLHDAEAVPTRTTGCMLAFFSDTCLHWHPSLDILFVDCTLIPRLIARTLIPIIVINYFDVCTHSSSSSYRPPNCRHVSKAPAAERRHAKALPISHWRTTAETSQPRNLPIRSPQSFPSTDNLPEIDSTGSTHSLKPREHQAHNCCNRHHIRQSLDQNRELLFALVINTYLLKLAQLFSSENSSPA